MEDAQAKMTAHYKTVLDGLLTNAERDVRLARAQGDGGALAKARARHETLKAALEIYAAAHLAGYGSRPWPRPEAP